MESFFIGTPIRMAGQCAKFVAASGSIRNFRVSRIRKLSPKLATSHGPRASLTLLLQ
jgi:hypothetical protein